MNTNAPPPALPPRLEDHDERHIQLVAAGLVKLVGSEPAASLLDDLYGEERATDALRSLARHVERARRNLEVREEYMQRAARRARRRTRAAELRVEVGDGPTAPSAPRGVGGSGRIVKDDLDRTAVEHVDRRL